MPKRKTTAEDAPVKDHKMRDDDESSSDVCDEHIQDSDSTTTQLTKLPPG